MYTIGPYPKPSEPHSLTEKYSNVEILYVLYMHVELGMFNNFFLSLSLFPYKMPYENVVKYIKRFRFSLYLSTSRIYTQQMKI